MATLTTFEGKARAVSDRILVKNMYFGEQKTKGGLIITDDNGTDRGIYPRWGRVHSKGPENNDEYEVGDWVLVEHGRWTRGVKIDEGDGEQELRMVEAESIMLYSKTKPEGVQIGNAN